MRIHVTSSNGKAFILENIESSATVEDIKEKVQQKDGYRLLYEGRELQQGQPLADYNIQDEATITLEQSASTSAAPARRKLIRCAFGTCTDKAVKIVGDCRYCEAKFCARHRLPEAHACVNLTNCKQVAHERNSVKLLSERCVASKV
ncbi:hypothetical protein BGW37DRAFT_475162 [Umbelopsis sp. PMI_123]|nr:hypothetical protein BGW37DRAFT_475162 [Umbelopsis sp. PMI_123]